VPLKITETKELLGVLELDDIKFYEFAALALDQAAEDSEARGEDETGPVQFRTAFRFESRSADYRVEMTVRGQSVIARVDAAAMYASAVELDVADEILVDFGDNVAMMTLFPYLRQAITDLGQRLGEPMILPVLPRGALSFALNQADVTPSTGSSE
jgi:hypothetical protein